MRVRLSPAAPNSYMTKIITNASIADRYGFYEIGDRKTYSKIELMDLYHQLPRHWQWHYNDEFFSSYNWQTPIADSLQELYRKRAQQLRQEYDYLILYYSGGYDSANMLYAFLENDIPIDEVCVFYSKHDFESNQYIELTEFTHGKIALLKQKYPNLKFRMLDYSEFFFNWDTHLSELGLSANLLDLFGSMLTINRFAQDMFYRTVPEWRAALEKGKKLAWVYGADKPMVRYHEQQWIFNFHDAFIQARLTPARQYLDDGGIGNIELFYWAPTHTCAEIIIKQCQELKRNFDAQAKQDFSKIPGAKKFKPGYGWEIDTMSDDFVRTIYPRNFQFNEKFYTVKNPQHIFGNRDQWFFNSNHEKAKLHKDIYMATQGSRFSHLHSWFNDGKYIHSGFKNCISCNYLF